MGYRCPTCTSQYRASEPRAVTGYVRCRVCGFLIDVAANRVREPAGLARPVPNGARPWPLFVAAFLLLLALAWVVAVVQRSGAL